MYRDAGISGSKGRDQRPGFDAMHKDAARRRFNVVMVWSVDRLGRSLQVAFAPDAILAGTGGTAGSPDPRRGALILNRRVPDRLASISPWLAAQATSNT